MPRVLLVAALAASLLASQLADAAEPAPADKQPVEVKFWVVEVSATKLRNLGFDWQALERSGKIDDAPKMLDFLLALEKDNLARVAGSPRLTTISGRSASLVVGPQLKIEVTPKVVDEQTIELAYSIDIDVAPSGQPERRLVSAHSTEVEAGIVTCLSQTNARTRDANGKVSETTLLILAKVTTLK